MGMKVPGFSSAAAASVTGLMSPDFVGFRELPQLLGVSRTSAARYSNRPDFPEPAERLASGRIWRRADVEAWAKKKLPLPPGRPPRPQA
jgi:prophage regulatory protein